MKKTVDIDRKVWLPLVMFALIAATALLTQVGGNFRIAGWYGVAVFSILSIKLWASSKHKADTSPVPFLRVAAVVPFYNEDPEYLNRTIKSLMDQTYRVSKIVLVDDGSTDFAACDAAIRWLRYAPRQIEVIQFVQNKGKREALAAGFRAAADCDVYLCVDSDTVLEPDALNEALRPMSDDRVTCVTGLVLAQNWKKNLLTRLIDLRYANAFLYERAAYSKAGSVLCACGSLALYRRWVVHKYLDDFLSQKFLGVPAVFGDDRRLTNYCLLEGRAVLQETAVAWTAVPEKVGHYIRQQVRWNKSFFRESLWVVQNMTPRKPAFWLTLLEITSWLTFTAALLLALVVHPILTGQVLLLAYGVYLTLLGYARSVRYFDVVRRGTTLWERLGVFLLAPLYGLMHLLLLLPLRLYSLFTLRRGSWGTRTQVEVAVTPGG